MQALSDDSMGIRNNKGAAGQGGCVDSVGDSIQRQRVAHGMSQAALAQSLGISRQSVAKWETGKSRPELEKMIRLCSLFGCTMDELVYGANRHVEAPAEREVPVPMTVAGGRETPDMPRTPPDPRRRRGPTRCETTTATSRGAACSWRWGGQCPLWAWASPPSASGWAR